jgi:hypothetical protein
MPLITAVTHTTHYTLLLGRPGIHHFTYREYVSVWDGSLNKNNKFIIPLTPELNPSAQRCLTKIFTGDFAS